MKTQIIFTCARCGKEQVETLNCFTVRRFKYRNLIGKDTRGYKLDKEICPDCYRSLKIWLNNGNEYEELVDENNKLKKLNTYHIEQRDVLQTKLREAEDNFSSCKQFCPRESSDWNEYQEWWKEKHKDDIK
jgi:hypothetical protein